MNTTFHQLKRIALSINRPDDYFAEMAPLQHAGIIWHRGLNGISGRVSKHLVEHANVAQLTQHIEDLFTGKPVNNSEQRAALHMALRASDPSSMLTDSTAREVKQNHSRVHQWAKALFAGQSPDGRRITDILHIGIGGSDLSPRLIASALQQTATNDAAPKLHFLSAAADVLPVDITPETTLIITASKSFTTAETLHNHQLVDKWLKHQHNGHKTLQLAVTANHEAAIANGFHPDQILKLWDWVGGRYAFSSAVSLSAAAVIGPDNWRELLNGAASMDQHFRHTPLADNLPVQLALHDYWHYAICKRPVRSVFSYAPGIELLANWLQQLETESNGKSVDRNHQPLTTPAAPLVLGGSGLDAQHAIFQNLHQGQQTVPLEFVGVLPSPDNPASQLHYHNLLAQMQTLHTGTPNAEEPWSHLAGNKPVSAVILERLDARTLGALLSAYEHKTFCYGALIGCNPFDQWGVEAGKKVARQFARGTQSELPTINALQQLAKSTQ